MKLALRKSEHPLGVPVLARPLCKIGHLRLWQLRAARLESSGRPGGREGDNDGRHDYRLF
jgi:hypothetical protein